MKKILFVLLAVVSIAASQSNRMSVIQGGRGYVLHQIVDWSGFTSDSLATLYTLPISTGSFDSTVEVWARGTSTNGSAKFRVVMQGGFVNSTTAADWDSLGVWADSTNVKLETLKRIGALNLRGSNYVRAKIYGNSDEAAPSATTNRKDTKITLYLIGRLKGYTQIAN